MVLLNRGKAGGSGLRAAKLGLLLLATFGSSHDLACPSLIRGVVQKRTNVVNEQGIQKLGDLLLIGEIKSTLERDPASNEQGQNKHKGGTYNRYRHLPHAFEMHRTNLYDMANLFTFEDTIPATTGHSGNIEKLGAIDHVVVCVEMD